MAADRELNHSDRRRSLKRRYLHLQVAGRSQFLSGSGGTSAASKRKFASDRAAPHAPSPAMTSAPRYFFFRFHSIMTVYFDGAERPPLEAGATGSEPVEPCRFADRAVNKIRFIPQSPAALRRYAVIQVVAAGPLVHDQSQSAHEFGR
jgi:hypothetical protein